MSQTDWAKAYAAMDEDYFEVRAAATRRADRQGAAGRKQGRKKILIGACIAKARMPNGVVQSRLTGRVKVFLFN